MAQNQRYCGHTVFNGLAKQKLLPWELGKRRMMLYEFYIKPKRFQLWRIKVGRRKKPNSKNGTELLCVWVCSIFCVVAMRACFAYDLAEVNENKWEFKCKQRPSSVVAVKRVEFAKLYANPMRSNNQIKRSCINVYIFSIYAHLAFPHSSNLVPCIFVCVFPFLPFFVAESYLHMQFYLSTFFCH